MKSCQIQNSSLVQNLFGVVGCGNIGSLENQFRLSRTSVVCVDHIRACGRDENIARQREDGGESCGIGTGQSDERLIDIIETTTQ